MTINAEQAVETVRIAAIELLRPDGRYGVAVDSTTYASGSHPAVLVGIARVGASVVLAIDAAEYTPDELAYFVGEAIGRDVR